MKKLTVGAALLSVLCAMPAGARDRVTHNPDATNTETILHAWSWNFPTIARNMKRIADAGYTMVQTSPVQHCYDPYGSTKKLFDQEGKEGNWYYYYQPTDWKIGNAIVGTKDQTLSADATGSTIPPASPLSVTTTTGTSVPSKVQEAFQT